MAFSAWKATVFALAFTNGAHCLTQPGPFADTKNDTYVGKHLPDWDQDVFLGMPFAQPPVESLRFRHPQSIDEAFEGTRNATEYGYSCMQYGQNLSLSEDCLTINVVRPSKNMGEPVPVLVWIYGGGLYWGSTADQRYNLSGIVKTSQEMDQPIIAVSLNYRVGIWGFLQNFDLLAEGSSNAGLLDQRLGLQWIRENIAAFGGDPDRITVWGESAGAQSIAYHMFSYDGRDDSLFRGAILESGGITGAQLHDLNYYDSPFENLTRSVGCWTAEDQIDCLRGVSQEDLYQAQQSLTWNPLIDGDFLTGYPSQLIREGKYNAVPMIIGANTDEGFEIGSPDTDEELFHEMFRWRNYDLSAPTIRRLMELYPDDPCNEPPYAITNCSRNPDEGRQWRRGVAIGADLVMISGRRKMAELFTESDVPVYSYRFDQRPYDGPVWDGVKHFENVQYSFQNISGSLGPLPEYRSHMVLARAIGEAYVRFVYSLDPNPSPNHSRQHSLLPKWPKYDLEEPKNMVLNATRNYVEDDTWRKHEIGFMNTYDVARELYA